MYKNVYVVKYCVVSRVSACVTFMTYLIMSPFCSSSGGGDHDRKILSEEVEFPPTLLGNPLGAGDKNTD